MLIERKKQRILDLLEILKQKTDEENSLTISEIKGHLMQIYGSDYKVDIRSIRDDLETLQVASSFLHSSQRGQVLPEFCLNLL